MATTRQNANSSSRKPLKQWIVNRLSDLGIACQAQPDAKTLGYYASSLSGFSEAQINKGCEALENEVRKGNRTFYPTLAELKEVCRTAGVRVWEPCSTCDSQRWVFVGENGKPWDWRAFHRAWQRVKAGEDIPLPKRYARPCPDCRRTA